MTSLGFINYGLVSAAFNAALYQAMLSLGWEGKELQEQRKSLANTTVIFFMMIATAYIGFFQTTGSRRRMLIVADIFAIIGAILSVF